MKIFGKIAYQLILYNIYVKNMTIRLFTSEFFRKNKVYQFFHQKRISSVMDKYSKAPWCVKIEGTNACNSGCIMCPHDRMKRKIGFMSQELFKRVADECAKIGVEYISLHNFGEPTLDKDFAKKVKYLKDIGLPRVSSNTNASCLNKDVSKALLEAGLDELYISLDAVSKETFDKIRRRLDYDTIINNVHKMIELKKKNPKYKTKICVVFVEMPENKHELKKFMKYWKGKADRVCIMCLHNWGGQTNNTTGVHEKHVSASGAPCRLVYTDLVVDWDGTVPLCCEDTEETVKLGDLNKQTIAEIWQSKKLQSIRGLHRSGRFRDIPICSGCKLNTMWWLF